MGWWRICGLTLLFVLLTAHFAHAYERDVHYDLTKYLAQWAGFSDSEAEQIAAADQELDTKPEFNPLPNPNFCPELRKIAGAASALAVIPEACKNDPEFQRMLTAQRAYHFVDGKRLQELRDSAFRGRNLKILGHYLHALQDTFSHSLMDYADLPPSDKLAASLGRLPDEKVIGHLLYGHSVDRTYERPDLAEQMARYVYMELTEFQGSANRWNDVEAAVVRFVNAKDLDKKVRYLSASSPSSPPVASSQPSDLPTKPQEPLYEGRTLVDWQGDLRDASSEVREKATQALGHFGDKAVPILAQTLGEPDPDVRWAAAYALGEIGPAAKDAVPALVQALTDPDDMVRGRAEVTLRRIDPSVLEKWEQAEKAAAEEDARLRKEAAQRPAQAPSPLREVSSASLTTDVVYAQPSPSKLLTHTTIDPDTKVRFSLLRSAGCRWLLTRYEVIVIGELPLSTDLSDNDLVKNILDKGREFALVQCPKLKQESQTTVWHNEVWVYLINYPLREPLVLNENAVVKGLYHSGNRFEALKSYNNRQLGRAQPTYQKGAAQRQAQQQRRRPCQEEFLRNFDKGGWAAFGAMQRGELPPCPKEGDEARKTAADRLNAAFVKAHRVDQAVGCETLSRNPFAFEGKVVLVHLTFEQMVARDKAILGEGNVFGGCGIVVSGVPHGVFSARRARVVVAGKVLGDTEARVEASLMKFPHLQFSGIHVCKEEKCADFFGPESLR